MFYQEETMNYFINVKAWRQQMPSMHYHSSYELYYLDSGTREYFVEDKFFSVAAGSFVLIPPSTFHRTGGSYARRVLIGFTHEFLEKTYTADAIEYMLMCFNKIMISPSEKTLAKCKSLLNSLNHCSSEKEFAIYLGTLLCELSKCDEEVTYNRQMSALIEYINMNFADIHSIEQIADHFYISKYHLCHLFKNTMNLTVMEYLNNIKIKNACDYLINTDKKVLEISQLCGFSSSAYFSNVFKKYTDLSPNDYRKKKKI